MGQMDQISKGPLFYDASQSRYGRNVTHEPDPIKSSFQKTDKRRRPLPGPTESWKADSDPDFSGSTLDSAR